MTDQRRIATYCENHSTQPSEALVELERETHLKTLAPQMLTGRLQGKLLSFISQWLKPQMVLEIGTFTGYGTICLSAGVADGGMIHTVEVNPELRYIAQKYFVKAGIADKVQQHTGDAMDVIPTIEGQFDLVYVDAGKQQYPQHYEMALNRMNKGGVLLADNVLWSGKVGTGLKDKDTVALESFNQMVFNDERVENLLLPIRDGLMVVVKK